MVRRYSASRRRASVIPTPIGTLEGATVVRVPTPMVDPGGTVTGGGGVLRLLPAPGPVGDHEPNRSLSKSAMADRTRGELEALIFVSFLVQPLSWPTLVAYESGPQSRRCYMRNFRNVKDLTITLTLTNGFHGFVILFVFVHAT